MWERGNPKIGLLLILFSGRFKIMDRPMTAEELFLKIHGNLETKNKIPDILDYGLATNKPVPIRTCEFDLKSNHECGENKAEKALQFRRCE